MNDYDALMKSALKEIKLSEVACIPPKEEINHKFSPQFEEKMERFFSLVGDSGKYRSKVSLNLRKAAAVILCVLTAVLAVVMSNPTVRADFANAVVTFYENYLKFTFFETEAQGSDFTNIEEVKITNIPEGFNLSEVKGEFEAKEYVFSDGKSSFSVNVSENESLSVITDKDNSSLETLKINNRKAYLLLSEDDSYSTVIIIGGKITVTIYGAISAEEAVLIAEGIK